MVAGVPHRQREGHRMYDRRRNSQMEEGLQDVRPAKKQADDQDGVMVPVRWPSRVGWRRCTSFPPVRWLEDDASNGISEIASIFHCCICKLYRSGCLGSRGRSWRSNCRTWD